MFLNPPPALLRALRIGGVAAPASTCCGIYTVLKALPKTSKTYVLKRDEFTFVLGAAINTILFH